MMTIELKLVKCYSTDRNSELTKHRALFPSYSNLKYPVNIPVIAEPTLCRACVQILASGLLSSIPSISAWLFMDRSGHWIIYGGKMCWKIWENVKNNRKRYGKSGKYQEHMGKMTGKEVGNLDVDHFYQGDERTTRHRTGSSRSPVASLLAEEL